MKIWLVLFVSLFVAYASAAPKSKKKNEFKDPRGQNYVKAMKMMILSIKAMRS